MDESTVCRAHQSRPMKMYAFKQHYDLSKDSRTPPNKWAGTFGGRTARADDRENPSSSNDRKKRMAKKQGTMNENTVYVARNSNKKLLVNWLATVNDVVESEIGAVVHGRLDDDNQLNYLMFTSVR